MSDHDTDVVEGTEATRREGPGSRPSKPRERLSRGTLVGRYVIVDVLGEGGMGVVYAAFDPELDRKVAIKLLQAKRSDGSAGDQAWLLREAQAMARLSHPNVIAVHDVGTLPGDRVFVAMELVDGLTLRKWLRASSSGSGPRSWRDVLAVMRAAGAGLAAAHAVGLVHRDFKPDNVLVGGDGRVRVMDFGLARLTSDDDDPAPANIESSSPLSATLTAAGTLVGTPAYMAPELKHGHAADPRSDQFSFGVALYEALFRTRPFTKSEGKAPVGKVPAKLQRVVMRAISADPEERYRSVDELLGELAVDVGRTRRRIAIGAAVAVALGGAVVAGFALKGSAAQLCTGAERRLAGAWDAPAKAAIDKAFVATKQAVAPQAFASLQRALDAYAASWTAAATDSCEATRIRGEQTEDVLTLRDDCLGRRVDELRALTQVLASADAELVAKADQVVGGLEPVSRCANIAALRAPDRIPLEPRVDELERLLARSKAKMIAGKFTEAVEIAKQAVKLAEAVHYAPFKAEALVVEGAALAGGGDAEASAVAATEAAWAAIAGRRDDVLAGAALSAAVVAAQRNIGEAKIWLGVAKSTLERFGHDPALELRLLEVEGLVAAIAGDVDAALAADHKALAAAERMFGIDSTALWNEEEVLGLTFAKAGAYDKARPHYERALALHERGVGKDHPDLAVILTNLGACYSHDGEDAKARAVYDRALAIRENSDGPRNPMFILTLNNMADGMIKSGDIAGAIAHAGRARDLAERLGKANPLYHAAGTTYAEALTAAGKLDDARKAYDEVVELEAKHASPFHGATLASRAQLELGAKRWADAATFAQRSIAAVEAAGGKDAPELWQPLAALARADLELGKRAEAKPLLERAIAIATKAHLAAADLAPVRALLERAVSPR